MQKKYTFHVLGMHCQSCVLLTEEDIAKYPGVTKAVTSLATETVTVTGDFGDIAPDAIATALTAKLIKHGYRLSVEKQVRPMNWSSFLVAIPLAFTIMALFIGLQKTGLVNLVDTSTVSYGTIFLVGVIASLSTCMAVVGGLVLSLSATFAKAGNQVQPQLLFHAGRLTAFFVLGGLIGALGANFAPGTTVTFVLSFLVGLIMLMLGINLLDVFPWAKKLQLTMPRFVSAYVFSTTKFTYAFTPLVAGVATFFLPCGFTQSMQIYSLTTGSFWHGALTMLVFALGTLPVLALLSFGSFRIEQGRYKEVFFKTAGLVVILFALLTLINSFVVIGLIPPIITF